MAATAPRRKLAEPTPQQLAFEELELGDIVREFVDACHKHGMKPGLYTPPWIDDHFDRHVLGLSPAKANGDIDKYDNPEHFAKVRGKEMRQQQELLTGYGRSWR